MADTHIIGSAPMEFFEFFKKYQHSCSELSKCSNFIKRKLFAKHFGDINIYCANANYENVRKELKDFAEDEIGKQWKNVISSFQLCNNVVAIKLDRSLVTKSIILEIFQSQTMYGRSNRFRNKVYNVSYDESGPPLTLLRISKAVQVMSSLIAEGGGSISDSATDTMRFSTLAVANSHTIFVCPVMTEIIAEEADYYRFWKNILVAMSNHKDISEETLCQLTEAAVTFDLLSIKLNKPLLLDLTQENLKKKSNKGAIFVLYNYTRVCMILDKFEYLVQKGVYQSLSTTLGIDCNLLTEEDEWILVYDLLLEWPAVVMDAQNLAQPKLHRITAFLSSLASAFSVYYRHTRVLTEGLEHLMPLINARIHLLMAIQQVFLNAFNILKICAPRTM